MYQLLRRQDPFGSLSRGLEIGHGYLETLVPPPVRYAD